MTVAGTILQTLLLGEAPAARCRVVVDTRPLAFALGELRDASTLLAAGDTIAYVVTLKAPVAARLITLLTLPLRLRNASRVIERNRLVLVGRYAIDPDVDAPSFIYQLDSPASRYADRSMRPRGSDSRLRRILTKWAGCDPALGAVALVARKP
jgi:hypothetical protein